MTNFLIRDALIPSLKATTKEGVIRELVQSLQSTGFFQPAQVETVVAEVLRREGLGTTGIGRQVAIPHSRFEGLPRLVGTLGISTSGIPFASVDHRDVKMVFLLLSRPDDPAPHLQALDMIVRITERDEFIADLLACRTRDEMWDLLERTPMPWDEDNTDPTPSP